VPAYRDAQRRVVNNARNAKEAGISGNKRDEVILGPGIFKMSHHELRSPPGMKWKAETDSTAFRVADFRGSILKTEQITEGGRAAGSGL
jgi:hypothetical protein